MPLFSKKLFKGRKNKSQDVEDSDGQDSSNDQPPPVPAAPPPAEALPEDGEGQGNPADPSAIEINGFHPYSPKKNKSKPLTTWWGRKWGIAPSDSVTSRRPKKIAGGGPPNFEEIRAECVESGTLFEDDSFPATDESVFFSRRPPHPFEWKRPSEIVENPKFFTDGVSRFDVAQGELGDCWFLAAVATLTMSDKLFYRVVPQDNSFVKDYAGIFHFQFWQYGHWIDVVVDDRIPTYNGNLVFLHSKDKNEFWSALLEKAYAKLNGSYEALWGGVTNEAMEDFTGGLTESYSLKVASEIPADLFKIMERARDRHSLMSSSIDPDPNTTEAQKPNGLVMGHAYSITGVVTANVTLPSGKSGKMPLVRMRNPWGNDVEWKGAWGDKSREWQLITEDEKKKLGISFEADGEFWMSYKDFITEWDQLEICNLDPGSSEFVNSASTQQKERAWSSNSFDGSWVKGATAGGCRNFIDSFASNPQFKITLKDPDEDDDDNKCTCIVALLQKNRRKMRKIGKGDNLTCGFVVYKVDEPELLDHPLDKKFFQTHASCARSNSFINLREICSRFKLDPGTYCIVPSTFDPNEEGEFVIRVFSETEAELGDVEEHTGYTEPADQQNGDAEKAVISLVPEGQPDPLEAFFEKLAGEDKEIDAWELRAILTTALKKEFKFDEFSIDTAKSLMAVMDISRSGKLDVTEFKELWQSIRIWKAAFKAYDVDKSGTISSFELKNALKSTGYRLHSRVLTAMVLRYGSQDGTMSFDNFIAAAVKLKTMLDIFNENDPKQSGKASFNLDAWTELTMYA